MKIKDILDWLDAQDRSYSFEGDECQEVIGFSSLANYKEGTVTWIKKRENIPENADIQAIALAIVQKNHETNCPNQIITEESKAVFFGIIEHFFHQDSTLPKIGQGTYISPEVVIGKNVKIGHNCVLDGKIVIGDNTQIYHNVTIINKVTLGKNCMIQSGVNIGHDGFGYAEDDKHNKTMIKHYGGTHIGNNVYIGGNTYIERGVLDNTVISDGCKIDGNCTIGHNSFLGKHCSCVAGTIILGSVQIGARAYIASATIKNQIIVGEFAFVGMGAVVTKDVPPNDMVVGIPAKSIKI
ncbi:hypothetical protein D3Z38_08500 [Clostridiales bacterium]|nr:hypothetical protein [Clostridiales bacterium]